MGIGAVGGQAQGKLSSVQTNDAAASLPSNAESTRAAELAAEFVSSESLPGLVVVTSASGGALTPEQLTAVSGFAETIPTIAIPGAGAEDPQTLGDALTGPVIVVPSEDGEAALITF